MDKKFLRAIVAFACAVVLVVAAFPGVSASANAAESFVPYVQNMVWHYRDYQNPDAYVVKTCLKKIKEIDPVEGVLWETIMADWDECNNMEVPVGVLPNGLPEDDSLCIVVLGFALNPDGSMKPELIQRLKVALASAQKYPNAYVAVTGGGTAAWTDDTEADKMAQWLRKQGISKDRIIVENESLNTIYNAVNTYGILVREYPQVKSIAVVTSDYHVPWGATLFQTVCDYTEVYGQTVIPVVGCAANKTGMVSDSMDYQAMGICAITGIPYKR